ncbi:hypothetical protein [Paraburkholderia sp. SIMBA_030]|uniref:hypothetical protein n=1 Tax=Paraburkholderia sp. SIMBA_030 TaxID=3085773 RepID=UPI00397DEBA2
MKIHHEVDPAPLREKAYMPIGDQIDAIMKGFDALAQQGVKLPDSTTEWIESCKSVKARFPKT